MNRRSVRADEVREELAFAEKAAAHFAKQPMHSSYGDTTPGSLLGLRWGLGEDCVLVLKLDENHIPTNYQNIVDRGAADALRAKMKAIDAAVSGLHSTLAGLPVEVLESEQMEHVLVAFQHLQSLVSPPVDEIDIPF